MKKALDALTAAAKRGQQRKPGEKAGPEDNLLNLAVQAARVRCTVGEISDALEAVSRACFAPWFLPR